MALTSILIGLVAVGAGLTLSAMFNLPPSSFIVGVSFLVWAITLAATRSRFPSVEVAHDHDHHHC